MFIIITQWNKSEKYLNKTIDDLPFYAEKFISHSKGKMQPTTLLDYAKDIMQFLQWLVDEKYVEAKNIKDIDVKELEDLYKDDIEEYRRYLADMKNANNEPVKHSTLNRKISALKTFYKYLAETEKRGTRATYIERNPMSQISLYKDTYSQDVRLENIQSGILVQQEIKAFREFVSSEFGEVVKDNLRIYNKWKNTKERDVAIISLILGTGLRISEVVDIKLTDIDFKSRTVMVYRKSGKKRSAKISKTAAKHLEAYLAVREKKFPVDSEYLFVTKYVKKNKDADKEKETYQMTKRAMQKMIKKYADYFQKPNLTAHKLRHSFATNHYAMNSDLRALQIILDHSRTETTTIYAHVFDSELHESIDFADE